VSQVIVRRDDRLPRPLTSFVGREQLLNEAQRMLAEGRLVTLTGPGGSGKSRLSVELAWEAAEKFRDGACFVAFAPLRDPALVLSTIADRLGLPDSGDRPIQEILAAHLEDAEILLVLDNFEHVVDAAPAVTELLGRTRATRVLVTSRSLLHVSGEQELPVPPLELPSDLSAAAVAECESVRLFVERAAAISPGFAVTDANAVAVAGVVHRLDGLPLAIELAAVRVKVLPPGALLERLDDALGLLVGGGRDLPDRQRTLRATISWSHELLSERGRCLLAVCSVFRGGVTLDVLEAVCAEADLCAPVVDGLQELVEHSLVRVVPGDEDGRYLLLETIREFAAERLEAMREAARIYRSHAAAYLAVAEREERALSGPDQQLALDRLATDHDNIRAALDWYRRSEPVVALRLAAAMARFWSVRAHFTEGRERLEGLLELVSDADRTRAGALNGAAWLAIDQGDYPRARLLLEESLALSDCLGDELSEGTAWTYLARSRLANLEVAEAVPLADRGLRQLRTAGQPADVALALMYAGLSAMFSDRHADACELFEEALGLCRQVGHLWVAGRVLQQLGCVRLELGDLRAARGALEEGLRLSVALRDWFPIPIGLGGFAGIAAMTRRPRRALRLAAAAQAIAAEREFSSPKPRDAMVERWLVPARAAAGASAARVEAEGRALTLDEAVALALSDEPDDGRGPGRRLTLTSREREVAQLVAEGLTNRQIAARLHLSVRTVDVHVDHVLTKLGYRNRTQLATWAYEEGLRPRDT
jgi:non-specific serine/threonine protein kinase